MSRRGMRLRPVWEDRYTLPKRADLLADLAKPQRTFVDLVRDRLLKLPTVEEALSWRGIPWRWTFSYSLEGEADRPFAYLVPCPTRPLFSIPVAAGNVAELRLAKVSRPVRDAIMAAMQVGGVRWPQWELTSRTQAEELVMIARRRHEALLAPA